MIKLNLDKKQRYLLACSFGPDSMALFNLLVEGGYNFAVAIVNYHLRSESDLEVDGLRQMCNKYHIKMFVNDIRFPITKNIEGTCRNIRYQFFHDLVIQYNFNAVLVAHNSDDVIETYLLQKRRHITPMFYGIKDNTVIFGVTILRPLLTYKKKTLTDYCIQNNVPFAIDKSNFELTFERNKIRNKLVTKMSDDQRRQILNEIESENQKIASILASIDYKRLGNISYFLTLDNKARLYVLNKYIRDIDPSYFISFKTAQEIEKALKSNNPNLIYRVKKDVYLIKEYGLYKISTLKGIQNYCYVLNKPQKLDTAHFFLDFTHDSKRQNVTDLDYPITIRNAHKDDVIQIKDYFVKARRLFIDWKMPLSLRKVWPVIINKDNKVIYIPRYREDFKITDDLNFYVKINAF